MGSVDDIIPCPECGGLGYYSYYYKSDEDWFLCHACGFHFAHERRQKEDGSWEMVETTEVADGVYAIHPKNGAGVISGYTAVNKAEFDEWLKNVKTDPDLSQLYLTKYDKATKTVTVIENVNFDDSLKWLPKGHALRPSPCDMDECFESEPTIPIASNP